MTDRPGRQRMLADGRLGDAEAESDLRVGQPVPHEAHDIDLASTQVQPRAVVEVHPGPRDRTTT